MSDQHFQRSLDTRALEIAAGTQKLCEVIERRMTRHEDDCTVERRKAQEQREQFRAEVKKDSSEIISSISHIHRRINTGLVTVLVMAASIIAFLFIKVMEW